MDPYAFVAALYEAEFGHLEADVAFYAREGRGGPLLVLGCGTGRVGRLLGSERPVTGLDRSEAMLEVARRRSPHARYVLGDMREFDVGRFDEIVIPNGGFSFLPTRADQQRCLASCRAALPIGGRLFIDVPMPDFTLLGTPHTPEKRAWEGRVDGRDALRTREVRRFPVRQRLELIDRYYLEGELLATSPLILRHIFPAEAEWMLEAQGFYVDAIHGDYKGGPLREGCPRLLIQAVRSE